MIGFAEGGPCVVVCEQGYLVLRANTHGSCSSNVCKSFFKIVFVSYIVNIFHPHSLITCLLPRRKRREKDSGHSLHPRFMAMAASFSFFLAPEVVALLPIRLVGAHSGHRPCHRCDHPGNRQEM